jgi:EAL domain-containing protein (putative c-di-GMP-specific phosphodiesterase class I)
VRSHLGMEIAYLSEFTDDGITFRSIDAPGFEHLASVGDSLSSDQVYCSKVVDGGLPELIHDTAAFDLCSTVAMTDIIPIKSHVSVPIHRKDGSIYGMFCCIGRTAKPDLNARDMDVVRAFAKLSADNINVELQKQNEFDRCYNNISATIEESLFDIVYQPIMNAQTKLPKGFEALCRFRETPYRPPNLVFKEANKIGLQTELEVAVIKKALMALNDLPEDIYVSVNASPETIISGALSDAFAGWPTHRIIVEVTEHSLVHDYDTLCWQIDALRATGVRLAIDDAGAGYSGLQHIIKLQPDIIKLDMSLTSNIHLDVVRKSLGAALVRFAQEIGACIVAEGVELKEELKELQSLGVPLAQGYLLGRPENFKTALGWFEPEQVAMVANGTHR